MTTKSPPRSTRLLYSVGYEGRTAEQVVDTVRLAGVRTVLDVRLDPVSHKPGLSKKRLADGLAEAEIEYVHEPLLGNPAENREGFRNSGVNAACERFTEQLSNGSREALESLARLVQTTTVALLCSEADASRCHRQVISDALQLEDPALMVIEL